MSRRQKQADENYGDVGLKYICVCRPQGLQIDQTDRENSNQSHMLIYEKDIDDKLDKLNSEGQNLGPDDDDKLGDCSQSDVDGMDKSGIGNMNLAVCSGGTPAGLSDPYVGGSKPEGSSAEAIAEILSGIETHIREDDKEEVFIYLIRSVKTDKKNASRRILETFKARHEDLCDDSYREKESSASLLHVALLYQRTGLCKDLICQYPGLLEGKYTSEDYKNQTCLHIAAANCNRDMIEFMLKELSDDKKKELLNTIADGRYFVEKRPEAATCLSAAVWQGKSDMISTLVNEGADLELRSIDGNTLLHYIINLSTTCLSLDKAQTCIQEVYKCCNVWWVRHKNKGSKSELEEEQSEEKKNQFRFDGFCHLLSLRNDSGLIPAALAVRIHSPLTHFILSFDPTYRQPQMKFGAVAWATYDVTDILSYKQGQVRTIKRYDCGSVLHTLAHTKRVLAKSKDDTKQKDIAELEPINSAIEMKWSVYRWLYLSWFLIHATYMIILTNAVLNMHKNQPNVSQTLSYAKPTTEAPINISMDHDAPNNDVNKKPLGLLLVIPVLYFILEVVDLLVCWLNVLSMTNAVLNMHKNQPNVSQTLSYAKPPISKTKAHRAKRLATYLTNHCTITGNAPYRLLAFSFATSMFTWYGMLISGNTNWDIPLSLALILGWIFMLNFTRACRHVCRFCIMIQKMFFRDFLYFISVYTFILVAFTSALQLLLPPGSNPGNTVMGLLNIVTNAGEPEDEKKPTQKDYATVVLSMYAILSVILLLNMLIAMMNTSYEAVKSSNTNLWRHQQLSILLLLERRFIWWGWLCRKSQSATRRLKMSDEKHSYRVFLDVTEAGKVTVDSKKMSDEKHSQRVFLDVTEAGNVNVDSKAGKRMDGFISSPSPSQEELFCSV